MKVNHRKLGKAKVDSGTHKIKPYQDPYASKRKGAEAKSLPGGRAPVSKKAPAFITTVEADKLRAANEKATARAAALQTENDALRKRNAELLEHNKRLIAEAVKK